MAGWFKSRQDVNYVEQPQAVYQDQDVPGVEVCTSCGGKLHPGEYDLCLPCFTDHVTSRHSVKIDKIVRKGLSGSFQGLRDI